MKPNDRTLYPDAILYHAPPIGGLHPAFALPCADDVAFYESKGGCPELPLILWAETLVPKDAVLLDVGANVGTWAVIWGLLGHPVIAYEANPAMAILCARSLTVSRVPDGSVRPVGLMDRAGSASLRFPVSPNDFRDGGASFVSNFDGGGFAETTVGVTALDAENPARVDFLKLDVEGAELDVLRGGIQTIRRCRPKILFEDWVPDRGQRREELRRFLRDTLRYTVRPVAWESTAIADPLP